MNNPISFPYLGIDWDPISLLNIGPLSIRLYGLLIGLGLILAVVYAWKRCRQFGIRQEDITDGVLYIVPFAIICARLYYCIFEWDQYAANPISVLYIWKGGLAIYGGVIGAIIGVAVFCHFRKIKLPALLDLVLLGFLIGQAIGRWGNFFNREAFGAETDAWLRMGLYDSFTGVTVYHHPTFLYESVWNALGFVALHFLSKKREYDGQIALGYAFWYGLGRFFIEGLRTDSLYLPGTAIRVSQLVAAVSCLAAAAVLIFFLLKPPAKPLFASRVLETDAVEADNVETDNVETDEEGGNEDA